MVSIYRLKHRRQTEVAAQGVEWGIMPMTNFLPLLPKGGEGRGEEADDFQAQIPSPQPSPRLAGRRSFVAIAFESLSKI
jgi:hypothetical protein